MMRRRNVSRRANRRPVLLLQKDAPPTLGSIMRVGARVLDDLLIITRELRRPEFERELVQFAGEAERHLVVLVVDGRTGVDAHVEGFIDGQKEWSSVRHLVGG